jgi:hypothetical protein
MKGEISEINLQKGIVAVLTETEGYSLFEIFTDDDIDVGDELFWSENLPMGDCFVRNLTKNTMMQVYFQNHWFNYENIKKQML